MKPFDLDELVSRSERRPRHAGVSAETTKKGSLRLHERSESAPSRRHRVARPCRSRPGVRRRHERHRRRKGTRTSRAGDRRQQRDRPNGSGGRRVQLRAREHGCRNAGRLRDGPIAPAPSAASDRTTRARIKASFSGLGAAVTSRRGQERPCDPPSGGFRRSAHRVAGRDGEPRSSFGSRSAEAAHSPSRAQPRRLLRALAWRLSGTLTALTNATATTPGSVTVTVELAGVPPAPPTKTRLHVQRPCRVPRSLGLPEQAGRHGMHAGWAASRPSTSSRSPVSKGKRTRTKTKTRSRAK